MTKQVTDTLMMIRPVAFHRNEQTAVNNYYQKILERLSADEVQHKALGEFDGFVEKLKAAGVNVIVFEDTKSPETPDSIFPNNWISFHESGDVILYPMYAKNRRLERRDDLIKALARDFEIKTISGFIEWESKNKFLEGTGSLVLDRQNMIAYAALSERTNVEVLADFSENTGFDIVSFTANQTVDGKRLPIYHTNVMMCLGERFALVCADSVDNEVEKKRLIKSFEKTQKEVIFISEEQKERFTGNILQVKNSREKRFVVMSESACKSLDSDQEEKLSRHGELLYSSLDTIECLGGGSARCMMAEVFLPKKKSK